MNNITNSFAARHGNYKIENGQITIWCKKCGHALKHVCTDAQAMLLNEAPVEAVFPDFHGDKLAMLRYGECWFCKTYDAVKETMPEKAAQSIINATREILEMCKQPYTVNTVDDCYQLTIDLHDGIDDEDVKHAYFLIRENMKRTFGDIIDGVYEETGDDEDE